MPIGQSHRFEVCTTVQHKSGATYRILNIDGGNILPLLDKDNNPVFDLDKKCQILQDTFFSGSHLSENNFDDTFKEEIESELSDIHRQETEDQIYDDALLNDGISLGEAMASLQYLKSGKAAGPDKIFTELLFRLVVQSHFFQTREAGVVMDAHNVIRVPQCLSNRARPVYTFTIDYLGQDRGQRSWSAKKC